MPATPTKRAAAARHVFNNRIERSSPVCETARLFKGPGPTQFRDSRDFFFSGSRHRSPKTAAGIRFAHVELTKLYSTKLNIRQESCLATARSHRNKQIPMLSLGAGGVSPLILRVWL